MKTSSQIVRHYVKGIGSLAAIIALAGFLYALFDMVSMREAGTILSNHWSALLLALLLYLLTLPLMWTAWMTLARGCGARASSIAFARMFLIAQIGKYLPGNVGHFLGRAYLAKREGIALEPITISMVLEVSGVLLAGAVLAGFAAALGTITGGGHLLPLLAGIGAIAGLVLSFYWLRRRTGVRLPIVRHMLPALACYLLVFALLVLANIFLLGMIGGQWNTPAMGAAAGAFVISWLIGFVTPGAPAGIGLREIGMYSLLAGFYPNDTVLLAVAGFRLVTMSGDGLAWLVGMAMESTPNAQQDSA